MKKSEIKIGGIYTNGKGRVRRVLDRTNDGKYRLYDGQSETDCLLYSILNDGTKANRLCGTTGVMTVSSFASWAKEALKDET